MISDMDSSEPAPPTVTDPLEHLSATDRERALETERRWRCAHDLAQAHPEHDPSDLYHALRCLELAPDQRLRLGLRRGRLRTHSG